MRPPQCCMLPVWWGCLWQNLADNLIRKFFPKGTEARPVLFWKSTHFFLKFWKAIIILSYRKSSILVSMSFELTFSLILLAQKTCYWVNEEGQHREWDRLAQEKTPLRQWIRGLCLWVSADGTWDPLWQTGWCYRRARQPLVSGVAVTYTIKQEGRTQLKREFTTWVQLVLSYGSASV